MRNCLLKQGPHHLTAVRQQHLCHRLTNLSVRP